eukprot:TRINITY_DN5629_c0_g1_i3.p1 TRINITY_DN5629_c0_g1~~TRINITY_DN5629_c0_g1_i3.p1  ORF type:complete len:1101 (+),score=403.70 TRINITY_DN5629_c0_g1_i3:66-3368(+)
MASSSSSSTTKKVYTPPDSSGSFYRFQQICNEIEAVSSYSKKTKILQKYLDHFDGDVYLFCKLMLCKNDKRTYQMREKSLVKVLSRILKCSLEKMTTDLEDGDLAETAKKFFVKEGKPNKWSTLTLKQVDDMLEDLSKTGKEDEQVSILKPILKKATGDDVKYIAKLIDHDLRINVGPKYVLGALHPDAHDAFKHSHDLKKVVKKVLEKKQLGSTSSSSSSSSSSSKKKQKDDSDDDDDDSDDGAKKKKKAGGGGGAKMKRGLSVSLSLMSPINPALAKACKSLDQPFKKFPEGIFCEIKYDGERIQSHKQKIVFKCYSRNLKEVQAWKVEAVEQFIPKATTAKSGIFDGEILLMDTKTHQPLPFGTLSVHKASQFKDATVCVFLFDVLYLDGQTLLDKPFYERRKILQKSINVVPNRVELSDCREIKEEDDLAEMMGEVLRDGLEGLVLKGRNSVYNPDKRHWMKLKKDYLEGMADSADLVVLGAYFGTGKFGSLMSVFLMGTYDTDEKVWKTVCKVGTGFDDDEIDKLQHKIQAVKIEKDVKKIPSWLDMHSSLVPDFIVKDPWKSPVFEVVGASFTESKKHTAAGISIRFPRAVRIRTDKDWKTHTNLKELIKLSKAKPNMKGLKQLMDKGKGKGKTSPKSSPKRKALDSDSDDDDVVPKKKAAAPKKQKKAVSDSDDDVKTISDAYDDDGYPIKKGEKRKLPEKEEKKPKDKREEKQKDKRDEKQKDKREEKKEERKADKKPAFVKDPTVIVNSDEESEDEVVHEPKRSCYSVNYIGKNVVDPIPLSDSNNVIVVNIVDDSGKWPTDSISTMIAHSFPEAKSKYKNSFIHKENHELGDIQKSKSRRGDLKVYVASLVCRNSKKEEIDGKALKKCFQSLSWLAKAKKATINVSNVTLASTNIEPDEMELLLGTYFGDKKVYVHTGAKTTTQDSTSSSAPATSSANNNKDKAESVSKEEKKSGSSNLSSSKLVGAMSPPLVRPTSPATPGKRAAITAAAAEGSSEGSDPLMSIFDGMNIYFYKDTHKTEKLKRYVIAFNGDVASSISSLVTHVVADTLDGDLKKIREKYSKIKFVSHHWVRTCCKSKKLISEAQYILL